MKKKKKGLLIACVALFFLLGGYLILKSLDLEEKTEKKEENKTVFEMNHEDITEIAIEYKENIYTFLYKENVWSYKEDEKLPLSQSVMSDFVSKLTSIEASREIKNPEELQEYGLEKPEVLVQVKNKNGKENTLKFGKENASLGSCYMQKNNEKSIFLVDSSTKQEFCINLNTMVEKEEIPSISATAIQKVEVKKEEKSKVIEKKEDSETGWVYEEKIKEQVKASLAADSSKVTSFMNNYTGIIWKEFVSYNREQLSEYGLDNPITITIKYQVEEEQKQMVLCIGEQNEEGDYYAMLEDGKNIYTLSSSSVKLMTEIEENDLVSSLIADYSFADLDKVTFVRNNQNYVVEKKKENDKTKYYLNQKEIEQNVFNEFYSTVSGMEWQSRVENISVTNSPEMTITFEKEGDMYVKVDYYLYDANFYLVKDTKGNESLVNKMKVKEMLDGFDQMIEKWNE